VEAVKAGAIEYLAKSPGAFLELPRIAETALRQWEHILKRREAEAELRRVNAELEVRIADRTAHLQGAVRELEAFTYSVAHDLRSPLRAIIGFGDALKEDSAGKLDVQALHYIDRMRDAAQRMSELIDDLLALSRVNRADVQRSAVNLSVVAEDVVRRLRLADPERPADVRIQADVRLEADPGLTMRLMENLLGNAWKFTCNQERASIEFGVTDGPGGHAYFVRDNGVGFDMSYADKLFIPFQRLHGRTEFPGTGIGLAIAQRVVLRHGGRIWADAKPDQGATFYFTLSRGAAE
jgi:signal transduction histidine kinase